MPRAWKYRLNIIDINQDYMDKKITPQQWLQQVISRIRENSRADKINEDENLRSITYLLSGSSKDDELVEMVENAECCGCEDDSRTEEENNDFLSELYDWADEIRCLISTSYGM